MTGLSESALNPDSTDPVLVVSTNWIGDCLMSLPAVRSYRELYPNRPVHVLCRPHLEALWKMSGLADVIHPLAAGNIALLRLPGELKENYAAAYIFPNSIRSALAARCSGASLRVGLPGHHRGWLLSQSVQLPLSARTEHQCWEAYYILGLEVPPGFRPLPQPRLKVSLDVLPRVAESMTDPSVKWTGLIPCAARGPSKEWPEAHFLELGRALLEEPGRNIVLFGGAGDADKCQRMAEALPGPVLNLAGKTSLEQWAACLACCGEVVANDSGGMHLAAALDIPVVAIFGITDSSKTGPLSPRARVIQESTVAARDIPRNSDAARECLAQVSPDRVRREILLHREGLKQECLNE